MNILTMNQNVFGSSFETTRRSNFTKKVINSELIVPDSAIELSYEEMEYIDGGLHLDQGFVDSLLFGIIGTVNATAYGVAGVATLVKGSTGYIMAALSGLAPVGIIIGVLGGAYISGHAWEIAEALVTSSVHRKGIDVEFGWKWGIIPWLNFNAVTK